MKRLGIVGAGPIGYEIAELCAIAGFNVLLADTNSKTLSEARARVRSSLEDLSRRGSLMEAPINVLSKIEDTTDFDELKSRDYVIESAESGTDTKNSFLEEIDDVVAKSCIVASNTPSIPVSELAPTMSRRERFIGLNFSDSPTTTPLVEVIKTDSTDEETLRITKSLMKRLNKEYVVIMKDIPGHIINRLNDRVFGEALTIIGDGVEKWDLDSMVRFRLNFPMGVCELMDFVGIDNVYARNKQMIQSGFNSRTSSTLKDMVDSGKIGIKSGMGFYEYPQTSTFEGPHLVPTEGMYEVNPVRLMNSAINEAAWIIRNGSATMEDIDRAMTMVMGWPDGPITMADKFGLDYVVHDLNMRHSQIREPRYLPDPLILKKIRGKQIGMKTGMGFKKWKFEKRAFGPVEYKKMGNFSLLTMNRPDKLNALNEAMWKGLSEALEHSASDDDVGSVFITGNGRSFSAGDDIEMMEKWNGLRDAKLWMKDYVRPLLNAIMIYPKPLVSLVNGLSFGGGCELNMLLDVVVAGNDSIFSVPEGLIGAMPPIASSIGAGMISRKLGRFALTGEWFSAREAMKLGLVDIVVPQEQLSIVMMELSGKLSRVSPHSMKKIKEALNDIKSRFAQSIFLAEESLTSLTSSQDFKEGQRAFLAGRKPSWIGR